MSHRFKSKRAAAAYIPERLNREERELRRMAGAIVNQDQLNSIMAQVKPEMQERGFERIRPFLKFKYVKPPFIGHVMAEPVDDIADEDKVVGFGYMRVKDGQIVTP